MYDFFQFKHYHESIVVKCRREFYCLFGMLAYIFTYFSLTYFLISSHFNWRAIMHQCAAYNHHEQEII